MDLSFLEGVSRVLTHTQVRVKSEVAASNTRARELGQGIARLGEGLEACSNPGPDTQVPCSHKCDLPFSSSCHPNQLFIIRTCTSVLLSPVLKHSISFTPQPVEVQALLDSLPALFEACSSRMAYLHCKASVYRGARVGFHKEVSSIPISAVNGAKSIQE